ncbi:hypothetical protein BBJ28_00009225 [Nothophytophthora sp. Chile5]|nr:hypothetical protein BBJ28_00009225 [Nothophytophthora sp. Chile5]
MGKKPSGTNTKVEAGRAKKAANKAVKDAKASAASSAAESAEWETGADTRSERKRAEEERKRAEQEAKKAEKQKLLALEEHSLTEDKQAIRKQKKDKAVARPWEDALQPVVKKSARGSRNKATGSTFSTLAGAGGSSEKMTQAEMAALREAEAARAAAKPGKSSIQFDTGFQANRNREQADPNEARSVDAALDLLTLGGDKEPGKHPERRAKAAYKAFEEVMMPQLKEDFPGLKLSQYKQKLSELVRSFGEIAGLLAPSTL